MISHHVKPGKQIPQWTSRRFFLLVLAILALMLQISASSVQAQTPSWSFSPSGLGGENLSNPTSLQFGPDNRLYVSQQNATIYAYNVVRNGENDYDVINTETINLVKDFVPNHNDDGTPNTSNSRQVTGIYLTGSPNNPVLYVSSSDSRIGAGGGGGDANLDTNSGVISRLTCISGMNANNQCTNWEKVDLVRGLPRSEENHSSNGMALDAANNILYLASGGFTNAGAPSNNFAFITEYALSAAILSIDLNAISALPIQNDTTRYPGYTYKWIYDLPTVDDPTRSNVNGVNNPNAPNYNGIDPNDPFGGNDGLNQARIVPGGPVQIASPGYRNLYDVIITEAGRMYGVDNGANGGWGGHPAGEADYDDEVNDSTPATGLCTNNFISGEPGSNSTGPGGDPQVNNDNDLHYIRPLQPGEFNYVAPNQPYYGGHPVPIRGNPAGAGLYTKGTHTLNPNNGSDAYWRTAVVLDANGNPVPQVSLPVDWPPVPVTQGYAAECDFRDAGYTDGALSVYGPSTNGLAEYTASNFNNALKGDLLLAAFNGNIYYVNLNTAGDRATNCPTPWYYQTPLGAKSKVGECTTSFASGFGSTPLDVIAQGDDDIFPGTVWSVTYGADNVTVFEPADYSGIDIPTCEGTDDDTIDEDGDGYTNADEIDNGTNPCSASSQPADFDSMVEFNGFKRSNLLDNDDDNDGIVDVNDSFAWDASNGIAYNLPFNLDLFNNTGYGFGSIGFTGLMTNGTTNYLQQFPQNDSLIFGGTSGLFTVPVVSEGDAYQNVNTQENGFQFGVNVGVATGPYVVRTRVEGPFFNGQAPQPFQSLGLQIGTGNQANYLKFVVNQQGFQVLVETNNVVTETNIPITNWASVLSNTDEIDLFLLVSPADGVVTPYYKIDDAPIIMVNPMTVPAGSPLLQAIQGTYTINGIASKLAVGAISTSTGTGPEFGATWDLFYINQAGAPTVVNTIDDVNVLVGAASSEVDLALVFSDDFGVNNLTFTAKSNNGSVVTTSISGTSLNLTFGQPGTAQVTVTADDGSSTAVDTFTVTVQDVPDFALRINAGGPAFTDSQGNQWIADANFTGGTTFSTGNAIDNTTNDALYQTERYNNFSYNISVPAPGIYTVNLYLAEIYFGAPGGGSGGGAGSRVFNVSIEGQPFLSSYDIFVEAGGALKPIIETANVQVSDGTLNIQFSNITNNAKVSALEILGNISGNDETPILVVPIPNQTSAEGDTIGNLGLAVSATGGDGNLSYAISNAPDGVAIEPTNGQIFGTIADDAANNSPYSVTITVDDNDANSADAQTINFIWTVTAPDVIEPGDIVYRINAGGPQIAASPIPWAADQAVNGSDASGPANPGTPSPYVTLPSGGDKTYGTGAAITNTTGAPNALFQTERWFPSGTANGTMAWAFPVTSGDYTVKLYFAEIFPDAGTVGTRVFDVNIEGQPALTDYDQFSEAGALNVALVETFNVTISDGVLNIDLIGDIDGPGGNVENPNIKGIEIIAAETVVTPALVFTPATLDLTVAEGGSTGANFVLTTSDSSILPAVAFSDNADWLTVNGAGNGVVINTDGLTPDTYMALVTASANGYTSAILAVNLTVSAPPPVTSLDGSVELQGRSAAPSAQWVTELAVTLYQPGTATIVESFTVMTDSSGVFSITNLTPGSYDVAVKGANTLQVIVPVTLLEGLNTQPFGVLLAGDANNNNLINLQDFSILSTTYNLVAGDTNYDARADFNGDGTVNLADFSLLSSNYNQQGEAPGN